MEGWFKLYRNIIDKPIWLNSTPEQKTILITLLAMANFKPNEWEWKGQKFEVKEGQFVTSLENIAARCGKGITIQNVRSALKRFEKLEFLTNESTKSGRLITIENWAFYQHEECEANKDTNKEVTKNKQRGNKEVTTNKECKKDKNEKNNEYIVEILDYMNSVCGTNYKPSTQKTKTLINARLNEKFTLDDFKKVIDTKYQDWGSDTSMKKYLRPETLFGTKFEGYLNQCSNFEQDTISDFREL